MQLVHVSTARFRTKLQLHAVNRKLVPTDDVLVIQHALEEHPALQLVPAFDRQIACPEEQITQVDAFSNFIVGEVMKQRHRIPLQLVRHVDFAESGKLRLRPALMKLPVALHEIGLRKDVIVEDDDNLSASVPNADVSRPGRSSARRYV